MRFWWSLAKHPYSQRFKWIRKIHIIYIKIHYCSRILIPSCKCVHSLFFYHGSLDISAVIRIQPVTCEHTVDQFQGHCQTFDWHSCQTCFITNCIDTENLTVSPSLENNNNNNTLSRLNKNRGCDLGWNISKYVVY